MTKDERSKMKGGVAGKRRGDASYHFGETGVVTASQQPSGHAL